MEVGTAENLSNLTWLVFALAALAGWRARVLPTLVSSRAARRSLIALAGVLLLMFPVISLSDDLHPDVVLSVEDAGKSRRVLRTADGPANAAGAGGCFAPQAGLLAIFDSPLPCVSLAHVGSCPGSEMLPPALTGANPIVPGRAPPVPSIA